MCSSAKLTLLTNLALQQLALVVNWSPTTAVGDEGNVNSKVWYQSRAAHTVRAPITKSRTGSTESFQTPCHAKTWIFELYEDVLAPPSRHRLIFPRLVSTRSVGVNITPAIHFTLRTPFPSQNVQANIQVRKNAVWNAITNQSIKPGFKCRRR